MTERRKDPRSLTSNYQERRRIAALEQQQSARSKAIDSRRRLDDLALLPDLPLEEQEEEAADVPIPSTSEHHSSQQEHQSSDKNNAYALEEEEQQKYRQQQQRELRQHWASQLMNPEWLIEIPTDLATEWYVVPRPEGQRCTIFASKGRTIARLRNGIIFENFQSMLPGGSRETSGGGGDGQSNYSLLDCIYHAGTSTYYILGKKKLIIERNTYF
jgi:snurportin-1